MCPVQWRKPSRSSHRLPFCCVPPDQHIAPLEAPEAYACIALHFPEDVGGSVPCMGQGECRNCHLPVKVHVYTVAAVYSPSHKTWRAMIVDLGYDGSELACADYRGMLVKIGRQKPGDARSNIIVKAHETLPQESCVHQFEPVDVRPHLMRRWGLFDEADRLMREPYYEQERLPFGDEKGKGKEGAA